MRAHLAIIALCSALLAAACSIPFLGVGSDLVVELRSATTSFTPTSATEPTGALSLQFAARTSGLPAGTITAVSWDAWLAGHWFASGTENLSTPLPPGESTVELKFPIALQWISVRPGPTTLQILVRGTLDVSFEGNSRRVYFRKELAVPSDGSPTFDVPEED